VKQKKRAGNHMMTSHEQKIQMRQRTKAFASRVGRFYCGLDKTREELKIPGKQLLRPGTSVAANYREVFRSRPSAELIAKIRSDSQEADDVSTLPGVIT